MCDVDACNAAAVHGPKCKYHTRAIDGLAVRKSRIPRAGSGLFATRGKAENEFVADYIGDVLDREALSSRYAVDQARYALEIRANSFIDAADPTSCLGRYANHSEEPNAVLFLRKKKGVAYAGGLRTVRRIRAGDEITVDYGPDYDVSDFAEHGTLVTPAELNKRSFSRMASSETRINVERRVPCREGWGMVQRPSTGEG